jgi:hypothetical protein
LITDIIITLDKINIALRSSWNKEFSAEDGNGMYFVNWKAKFDETLKCHISKEIRTANIFPLKYRMSLYFVVSRSEKTF